MMNEQDYAQAFRGADYATEVAIDENEGIERLVIEGFQAVKMRIGGFACGRALQRFAIFHDESIGADVLTIMQAGIGLHIPGTKEPLQIVMCVRLEAEGLPPLFQLDEEGTTTFYGPAIGPVYTRDFLWKWGYVSQLVGDSDVQAFCRITPIAARGGGVFPRRAAAKLVAFEMGYSPRELAGLVVEPSMVMRSKIVARELLLAYVEKHALAARAGKLQRRKQC